MLTLLFLPILLALYVLYDICRAHLFSPYRDLPRPKQPPLLSRLWHDPDFFDLTHWMRSIPNDGLIRYFGFWNREILMITTTGAHKELLGRDSHTYSKTSSLAALQWPVGVSGLVSAHGILHKSHRREIVATYSPLWARTIYPKIWQNMRNAATALSREKLSNPTGTVKINRFMRALCLDIAGHVDFSLDLGALADGQRSDISSRYLKAFDFGDYMPLFLKLARICPAPLQLITSTFVSEDLLHIDVSDMLSLVRRIVNEKISLAKGSQKSEQDEQDLTDMTIRRAYPQISERALLRHVQTTLGASVEMVSNQLAWAIYALSLPKNEHIQDKLRAEIRSHFDCEPETITHSDLKDLAYLNAVVNEVLRMYPSVSHRWRICKSATTLLGRPIHKGTWVVFSIYSMNRDPALWGPDADEFRPERWTTEVEDMQQQPSNSRERRDAYAFMTFGQGPRKCLGEHYSRAVMVCAIMGLVGRFRFTAPPDGDVLAARRVNFAIVMKAAIEARVEEVPGWD